MNTINDRTIKYLLVSLALLVGIPLFVIPTFVANDYNIYAPVVAMAMVYGTIISYIVITNYKYNV